MPTSDPEHLTPAAQVICNLKPESVLDIGVGLGKWGMIAREYSEAWCKQRYLPKQWKTKIIGVEIYPEYHNPAWYVYDKVFVGDAAAILPEIYASIPHFDLTIMMDVIEHIPREHGLPLIKFIMSHTSALLLSFANIAQKDVCSNKHEDHVSLWSIKDFQKDYKVEILDCTPGEVQALMLLKP